jgi:hypothetical protein
VNGRTVVLGDEYSLLPCLNVGTLNPTLELLKDIQNRSMHDRANILVAEHVREINSIHAALLPDAKQRLDLLDVLPFLLGLASVFGIAYCHVLFSNYLALFPFED